ncbi:MAG: hypothetical protein EHM39_02675, partial [Chloroflexi bacterium]
MFDLTQRCHYIRQQMTEEYLMQQLSISTHQPTELIDITRAVEAACAETSAVDGVLYLFCPHTTAGLTLNENWDPDVQRDLLLTVDGHIAPADPRHR